MNVCWPNDWTSSWGECRCDDLYGIRQKLDLRPFHVSWVTAFNVEGLCNLLHTQTGAGNCRDIPVAQHVGLIVCCKEGELVPQRTVDRLSQRMLGTTCYRTWACVRWFGGWFKAVGLCFGLDDVRKQAWLGVLADGTGRWVGWICWCWTGESSGHPYSPGWGGVVVWTMPYFCLHSDMVVGWPWPCLVPFQSQRAPTLVCCAIARLALHLHFRCCFSTAALLPEAVVTDLPLTLPGSGSHAVSVDVHSAQFSSVQLCDLSCD